MLVQLLVEVDTDDVPSTLVLQDCWQPSYFFDLFNGLQKYKLMKKSLDYTQSRSTT